jgi:hypothetical protein
VRTWRLESSRAPARWRVAARQCNRGQHLLRRRLRHADAPAGPLAAACVCHQDCNHFSCNNPFSPLKQQWT